MDTAYNRRISSAVDAINYRAARHAPANFVGRGYGSDSGLSTQYNDVMGAAHNHPRALSRAEREYRMEGERNQFGRGFFDDLWDSTPIGFVSNKLQGRGASGGQSYAMVGTTMPFREVPRAGVEDYYDEGSGASGGLKYPENKVVQVGNMAGSGRPQVGCAWYNNFDDFRGGRNRMMESKKIGRMTKMPDMPSDLSEEEMRFIEDLFHKGGEGAGYYGGEWYNNWDDFTEAISDAYDTVKGVWEDYIKPVLDVVGTPLKDALIDSGNPYGEAAGGVLELLGYGMGGNGSDGNGRPGVSGGGPGVSGGGPGYGGGPGMSGGRPGVSGGLGGAGFGMSKGAGVFADAKPIPANSLGFSPALEVEQLNSATGSVSYGNMPTSNPVGSGIGGKKKRVVKNAKGVMPKMSAVVAPSKMGEGHYDAELGVYVTTPRDLGRHADERYTSMEGNSSADKAQDRLKQAAKDILEEARRNLPDIAEISRDKLLEYVGTHLPPGYGGKVKLFGKLLTQKYIDDWKQSIKDEVGKGIGGGDGIGGSRAKERDGLEISGANAMGTTVAERGNSKKAQKMAAAVVDKASENMWNGTQMENTTGRSAKANPSLVLEGGSHPLTQVNNLQAVYGGNAVRSGLTRRGVPNAFSSLVKKVMAEKGMKLGQASKYIKENGLYKK